MSEKSRKLGERLREQRDARGFGQEEFGLLGGVTRRTISAWERGQQSPTADFLASVAEIGVDVLYVVTGRRERISADLLSQEATDLVAMFNAMDLLGKARLLGVAQGIAPQPGASRGPVGGNLSQPIDALFDQPVELKQNKKRS